MRQAGMGWWAIFSTSSYTILLSIIVLVIYAFAIYRGAARGQEPVQEHPLTSTLAYMLLYSASPLLGALAGLWAALGLKEPLRFGITVIVGTLGMTFFVWVIVDPALGFVELLMPGCRKHRRERLERKRQVRRQVEQKQRELLNLLEAQELEERKEHQELLADDAAKLAKLVQEKNLNPETQVEQQAIDIGVKAWQMGGHICMTELHKKALEYCRHDDGNHVDYISIWWDGIGQWRSTCLTVGH